MAVKKTETKQEFKFSKEQILASNKYKNRRDVLGAILVDDQEYTMKEVETLLEKFMKGKVI